jgi:hypothetical protein
MASGTIKGTKQGYYGVEIDWVATANSASANTSTVVSKVYITYYSINIAGRTATSNINGTSVSFSVPAINDKPNASTRRLIYTHTATVQHNTDGTKTGVTISASFPFNLSSSSYGEVGTLSASKSVNFDAIARTSTLSLPSTTLTTDTAFTATITKPDSTFRSRLAVLIDGTQKAITDYFTGTSYSYTIPSSFIPSDSSDNMVLRLYTYTSSGTTALGYVDKPVTVNVLSTLKPTVSISAAISSGGLNGYYVQNKSIVKLTVSSKAGSGSTIKSYTFTGPNVNASTSADSISVSSTATSYNLTTGIIKSTGTLRYQVTVYDARGRYATAFVDIYVYQYAAPEITTVSIQRCNSSGVLAKDGTYVKYTINSKFSPVLVGTTINNWRTVTICHSSNGGSTYGSVTTLQDKTTTDTSVTGQYGGGSISTSNAYKFKIVITDQYGATDTEYVDLGSIERPINIAKYGNGVSFGGFSSVESPTESGLFECHWDAQFNKNISLDGILYCNGVMQTKGATKIADNSDFNDLREPGSYIVSGTAAMATLSNRPSDAAGKLIVSHITGSTYNGAAWSYLSQEFYTISSHVYQRLVYTEGTANAWKFTEWRLVAGDMPRLLEGSGYQKLPSGVIIQWGSGSLAASTSYVALTFPIAFPTRCFSVICQNAFLNSRDISYSIAGANQNGFTAYPFTSAGVIPTVASAFYWIAIGY